VEHARVDCLLTLEADSDQEECYSTVSEGVSFDRQRHVFRARSESCSPVKAALRV
jgi:hypothetical protein